MREFIKNNEPFFKAYLKGVKNINDSILAQGYTKMVNEPQVVSFYKDVQDKFGDLTELKLEFEEAFKHIKYYYPDYKIPKVYILFTGLGSFWGNDLYVSQDMIVVSIEFFMGENARFTPNTYDYIKKRYRKEYIVPKVLQYISVEFNKTDFADKTGLAEMVYYGKSYQFVKTMVPCLADSILGEYTGEQIQILRDESAKATIWGFFLEKNVLFSTSHLIINPQIEERPFTAEIDSKAPPRLGRWLGWKIIKNYAKKNNDITFQTMMANQDAKDIFNKSGYKGE